MLIFFFNDTATTEIYTLSLHDALPISCGAPSTEPVTRHHDRHPHAAAGLRERAPRERGPDARDLGDQAHRARSEEHTSELQSPCNLVCRLLLEKKKTPIQRVFELVNKE